MGRLTSFHDRQGRELTLREVTETDAAAMLAFTAAVDAESTFLSREPAESPRSVPLERQRITQVLGRPGSLFLVVVDDDLIVAALDFHGGTRKRTSHAGEFGLSVRKPYWNAGLGGRLLDALIEWARQGGLIRKIRLRVQAGNAAAIALYRSRGFTEEGRLARELRVDGAWVDLLVMALWLD